MTSEASWLRHITSRLHMHVDAHFCLVVSSLSDGSHTLERNNHTTLESATFRGRLGRKARWKCDEGRESMALEGVGTRLRSVVAKYKGLLDGPAR